MNTVIICGSTCGHSHDSINGPTGCCAEHGPYMYFCNTCHEKQGGRVTEPNLHPCEVCGKTDPEKPMCYRSEPYCSDQHRKKLGLKKELDIQHGRSA